MSKSNSGNTETNKKYKKLFVRGLYELQKKSPRIFPGKHPYLCILL